MPEPSQPAVLTFEHFVLDVRNARLTKSGEPLELAPKAFAVLCHLAARPGQLVTKHELLDAVWGRRHVSESVLKTAMSAVRQALGDDARQPRFVATASRRGYRFIASTAAAPAPALQDAASPENAAPLGAVAPPPLPAVPLLIGREQPLQWLLARWRAAAAGECQIVLLGGEPGIGKTTLIGRFAQELTPADCALGQCVEQYGAGEPYLPVLEAINAWCRGPRGGEALDLMRQVAPTWLAQLPWYVTAQDRDWLQREVQGATQARMLREMGELLERCTQRAPLLLVIEDLHWSDQATVQLVDYLARRRTAMRLMLLASFRPTEIVIDEHPLKSVRQELRLHRLCQELHLEAFSEQQIFDYLKQRFDGTEFPEPFVRALHSHTEGLPLFVVNAVDELLAQRAIDDSSGRWQVRPQAEQALQVPENIVGIIEKQISSLPGDMRALLEAASVAGMEFRPEAVAAALEREPEWVTDRCETLARHRHWLNAQPVARLPGGSLDARYRFRHALYRHVFYQRIGAPMRARLHRRIARALESDDGAQMATAAELALHCELGYDYPAALRHYVAAVGGALNRFAHAEAAQLAERALALVPSCADGIERQELELALVAQRGVACAQWLGIASPEAIAAFERALALCDILPATPARAWVLSGLGWAYYTRAEFATARGLAQRIHDLAVGYADPLLFVCACNLLGGVMLYQGELAASRGWFERGLAACEVLGEQLPCNRFIIDPHVSMLIHLSLPLLLMGFPEQARRCAAEAQRRAQRIDEPMAHMLALWGGGLIEAMLEQPPSVAAMAERLARVVADHTLAQGEGPAHWLRGWARARLGEPLAGHAEILEGYGCHLRVGMYAGASQVLHHAVEALMLAGDWAGAGTQADEAVALARRLGEGIGLAELLVQQGCVARQLGQQQRAEAVLREALAEARRHGALWTELSALQALCEVERPHAADAQALAAAFSRLGEGHELPRLQRAKRLLAKLGSP